MTRIGLAHYGGTLGLYNESREEQVRALAFYSHLGDLAAERRAEKRRADAARERAKRR